MFENGGRHPNYSHNLFVSAIDTTSLAAWHADTLLQLAGGLVDSLRKLFHHRTIRCCIESSKSITLTRRPAIVKLCWCMAFLQSSNGLLAWPRFVNTNLAFLSSLTPLLLGEMFLSLCFNTKRACFLLGGIVHLLLFGLRFRHGIRNSLCWGWRDPSSNCL